MSLAACAARLGADTTFLGKLGRDAFGEEFLRLLEREGVNRHAVLFSDERPTAVGFVVCSARGTNLIVILCESLSSALLDESVHGVKGLTPNFLDFARHAYSFRNLYSADFPTIKGQIATLASFAFDHRGLRAVDAEEPGVGVFQVHGIGEQVEQRGPCIGADRVERRGGRGFHGVLGRSRRRGAAQCGSLPLELATRAQQLDVRPHGRRELIEQFEFVGAPDARREVEGGERADDVAVGGDERTRGAGGDAQLGHGGVLAQALVGARVAHGERVAEAHERAAEGMGQRRLAPAGEGLGESDGAADDLAVGVEQADQGGGGVQHPLGDPGEAVEGRVGGRVEQPEAAQRLEASGIAHHPVLGIHGRVVSVFKERTTKVRSWRGLHSPGSENQGRGEGPGL